jgi:hypothetical protein
MNSDLIDRYLDQLLGCLRGPARDVRRILAEAEEHLRDATAEALAAGATEEEAQRQAIARFGDARTVARRFSSRLGPVPLRAMVTELLRAATVLGAVAMVAVGVSGALAELFGRAWGAAFVAGDLPGTTYTPARCADFIEYFPHAGSCEAAASLHHWGEVVEYRVAMGALGLLVLGGYAFLRRARRQRGERGSATRAQYLGVLPDGFSATVATSLYGVAAAGLLLQSLNAFVIGGASSGSGQWLSGAVVALVMAAVYGASWLRMVAARGAAAAAVAVDA